MVRFTEEEFTKLKQIMPTYEWGMKIMLNKLNIIHEDLKNHHDSGAIEHIIGRIKDYESISQKLAKLNIPVTAENAKGYLRDIAGIRIICPFSKDVYLLANTLKAMPGITVIDEKDFINSPKPSGYRSYHLITEVPVFHSGKTDGVVVEIQIRTEAMNFWATMEHKARYKYHQHIPQHLSEEFVLIADKIAELDERMHLLHEIISLINEDTKT